MYKVAIYNDTPPVSVTPMKKILLIILLCIYGQYLSAHDQSMRQQIDLKGTWKFALDPDSTLTALSPLVDEVVLPGTTDTNRKGNPCTNHQETSRLSRLYSYIGKAWYRREVIIPRSWHGKQIWLTMERTKPSRVYIDGRLISSSNDISTPQIFNLTKALTPGPHQVAILVDNNCGVPRQLYVSSHAYTEDTQTNWNGIIGRFYLEAVNTKHILGMTITPSATNKTINVKLRLAGKINKSKLNFVLTNLKDSNMVGGCRTVMLNQHFIGRTNTIEANITLGNNPHLWSEFHPDLYRLTAIIEGSDTLSQNFGFVEFETRGTQFFVNSHLTFLRGKHDACVFPQTGHVPMDLNTWMQYLGTLKDYGLNHVRFHSWCPPDAAFTAADQLGIYLQPELPFWGDFNEKDTLLMSFLHKEGENILRTYGHHPSFVMMALGNELWGSIDAMASFVSDFRKLAPHRLYTFGSNFYLGYQSWKPGMDYFVTCRVGGEKYGNYETHTRGSFSFTDAAEGGILNHFMPNSTQNFGEAISKCPIPVISHETAQFQTYPDFAHEISEYHGTLYPYNMDVFRQRLRDAGMADQALDFHRASGAWSAKLYKADIEIDLRTKGFGGFQLLDLQDYPGQGSSYVGILDANMQSKNIITREQWRNFCSPVVPLLITQKFIWKNEEAFTGQIQVANYLEQGLQGTPVQWQLAGAELSASGRFSITQNETGLLNVGTICVPLSSCKRSQKLSLTITMALPSYLSEQTNTYEIWVYPAKIGNLKAGTKVSGTVMITDTLDEAISNKLFAGSSVLLMPDSAANTVGGLFTTDYWNYRMFKTISESNHRPVSPGTLGILTYPHHPLFADFPTDEHTNWQWFTIIKASHPLILDRLPKGYKPIVQVIDNIERNHKLGLIFEFKVGKGRLLVCMSNLRRQLDHSESSALFNSILCYMQSANFSPETVISKDELKMLFYNTAGEIHLQQLNNISY